jgi:hypothetical protein
MRSMVAAGICSALAAAAVAAPAPAGTSSRPIPPPPAGQPKPKPFTPHKHKHKRPTHVTCTLNLYAVIKQPAPTAANFGTTRCSAGLGTGVQQDSSTTTRTSPTTGSFTGPFKMFFDQGTIYGTFTISFVTTLEPLATDPPSFAIRGVAYTGTLKVTRGSGRYSGVRGSGTLTGTSPDAVQTQLVEKLRLTGL